MPLQPSAHCGITHHSHVYEDADRNKPTVLEKHSTYNYAQYTLLDSGSSGAKLVVLIYVFSIFQFLSLLYFKIYFIDC